MNQSPNLVVLDGLISGPAHQGPLSNSVSIFHCSVEKDWYELIEWFWQQKEVHPSQPSSSSPDQACETHYVSTHTRPASGQYQV